MNMDKRGLCSKASSDIIADSLQVLVCFVGSEVVAVMVVKDSLALVLAWLGLEYATVIKYVTGLEIVVLTFLKLTAFQVVS